MYDGAAYGVLGTNTPSYQQQRERKADDVTASHYHGVLPANVHATALQQLDATQGCA
jgi:hypothetical protein